MKLRTQLPQDLPARFHFAPSALDGLLVRDLGRCPRLLHFAPLALSN